MNQKAPIYLYDSGKEVQPRLFYDRIHSFKKNIDSESTYEERDLFVPTESISWDTPILSLLDRVPYGIFLQYVFSLYEIGLINTRTLGAIIVNQLGYFFKHITHFQIIDEPITNERVRSYVNTLVRMLFHSVDPSMIEAISSKIIFNLRNDVSSEKEEMESLVGYTNERMKQLASLYHAKQNSASFETL
jgi:hypothetical protein